MPINDPIIVREEDSSVFSRASPLEVEGYNTETCSTMSDQDGLLDSLERVVDDGGGADDGDHDSEEREFDFEEELSSTKTQNDNVHDIGSRNELQEMDEMSNMLIRRSASYIKSLPVVDAQPEICRRASIVAEATEIVPIDCNQDEARDDRASNDLSTSLQTTRHAEALTSSPRASLISVRAFKKTSGTMLGISFHQTDGVLRIKAISSRGILAACSSLQAGDRVLGINNSYCTGWTAAAAAKILRDTVGFVSILAENPSGFPNLISATVFKPNPEDKVGIAFKRKPDVGKLQIQYIRPTGLLGGQSLLSVNDCVVSINNVPCSEVSPTMAKSVVSQAGDYVTFLVNTTDTTNVSSRNVRLTTTADYDTAEGSLQKSRHSISNIADVTATEVVSIVPPDDNVECSATQRDGHAQPAFISVTLFKETVDTKLGIRFINVAAAPREGGGTTLKVAAVVSGGLLSSSSIRPGMTMISVNNERCKGWDKSLAVKRLRRMEGEVNIVVQNPDGDPNYVEAVTMKRSPSDAVGIGFREYSSTFYNGHSIRISFIRPAGLLANSILNAGDSVVAINNIPCRRMSPKDAALLVKRSTYFVTMLTKTHHSTAVVVSRV